MGESGLSRKPQPPEPHQLLRRDFVDADECSFCYVPLTKGVAFVFKDARGQERFAGPTCGLEYVRPWREQYLDLAGSVLAWTVDDEPDLAPSPETSADSRTPRERQRRSAIIEASEYVVLRQRCLVQYAWARCDKALGPMLERIDAGTFDAEDAERVLRIIGWAEKKSLLLSFRNVRACYRYTRQVSRVSGDCPPAVVPPTSSKVCLITCARTAS